MDLFRGTTALITGASRGIGAALADQTARLGANLILVGRSAQTLEPVQARARSLGVSAEIIAADLAHAAAPSAIERAVRGRGLVGDHLINNAGVGLGGRVHELALDAQLATIDVNIRAVTELAARFLPDMLQRRRGGLLNIASTSGWQGLVWLPVYSASKAYIVNWSEAVWATLRDTGVRCCCVSPGPVDTPFFDHNRVTRPPRWVMQSPDAVARVALRAYRRDDCHVITHPLFRVLAWSTRLGPRALAARIGAFYGRPPGSR